MIRRHGAGPDFRDHAVSVPAPGAVSAQDTMVLGKFLRDVTRLNEDKRNFEAQRQVREDQEHRVGDQQLHEVVTAINPTQQQNLAPGCRLRRPSAAPRSGRPRRGGRRSARRTAWRRNRLHTCRSCRAPRSRRAPKISVRPLAMMKRLAAVVMALSATMTTTSGLIRVSLAGIE